MEDLPDIVQFCHQGSGLRLRSYQQSVARAVVEALFRRQGLSLVVMFPRQSGKNELQAQIECFLLFAFERQAAEMVKISPTWKPQSLNAMQRLERALQRNTYVRGRWKKEHGYIYRLGQARLVFLSGEPTSNVVGATASLLLECDEAQDVSIAKWDKEIAPMAAAYNATRLFWGTAWTSQTLLGRELRLARLAEESDGIRRAFTVDADQVGREAPAYGAFVAEQVQRFGRQHPLVRTQFYNEELDFHSALFTPERLALMRGDHPARLEPLPGRRYALLVDVGGEEALLPQAQEPAINPRRDSTALTVVESEPEASSLGGLEAPVYRVVCRQVWTGIPHRDLYERLLALAEHWQAHKLVIDATGVGAGLASFLERRLGKERLIPFHFSAVSKSELGWRFISLIETGRYKEFRPGLADLPEQDELQRLFWAQAQACQSEVLPGPNRLLRWGALEGRRAGGVPFELHDDLLISAALCAALERQDWGSARSALIPAVDILGDFRPAY